MEVEFPALSKEELGNYFNDSVVLDDFIVKNSFIAKCLTLFQEPSELKAADKIKNGEKPQVASIEIEEPVKKKKGKK